MIELPPRRELPGQVRDQMLMTVREGIDTAPPKRSRMPYAVAAGVAVLVAGGLVITGPWRHDGNANPTIVGDKGVEIPVQRCVAAAAKIGGYPKGAHWRVVAHMAIGGHTTLAIKVDDQPVFCDTTGTQVELSRYGTKPDYVPGSKTGALMYSATTRVLGVVVDPSWGGMDAYEQGVVDSGRGAGYQEVENMVLWWPEYPESPRTVAPHGGKHPAALPDPHATTATVVDRPYTGPPVDRTSDRGKFVARCLDVPGSRVPDPDTWQPGAWVRAPLETFMVIRGVASATFCSGSEDSKAGVGDNISNPGSVVRLPSGSRPVLAGEVRTVSVRMRPESHVPQSADMRYVLYGTVTVQAASMTIRTGAGQTVTADVHNGTFAADAGPVPELASPDPTVVSVTVKDAHGKVLYQGAPAK